MADLTKLELRRSIQILARRDPDLGRIFREFGGGQDQVVWHRHVLYDSWGLLLRRQ